MPRYPIRARRRPGRVGSSRMIMVVGGAYVAPGAAINVYPIRGGGYYPALCLAIFEVICLII